MPARRLLFMRVAACLLLGGLLAPAFATAAAQGEACFQETGFCVRGRFLDYWTANDGLARNGFPLTGERREILEDGRTYTVQYFERVRLEYHPENPAPYDVLLGQFGRRIHPADPAAPPIAGQAFFAETGHNVGEPFRGYWMQNGGLAQFGFPLTEVLTEGLTGGTHQVQYFERARFEYHPEHDGTPYDVLLGQFGRQILGETALLAEAISPGAIRFTPYGALYTTNERARTRLGAPQAAAYQAPGAILEFEHGRMVYLGDPNAGGGGIAVLCGDQQSGQAFATGRNTFFLPDPWGPGQPSGGGAGPRAGLYEPARGFGALWREGAGYPNGAGSAPLRVRDCLGYATTPDAVAYTATVQQFAPGVLLSTPEGQAAYALFFAGTPPGPATPRYERFALPTR